MARAGGQSGIQSRVEGGGGAEQGSSLWRQARGVGWGRKDREITEVLTLGQAGPQ